MANPQGYSGGQREFDPGSYDRYFGGGKAKAYVLAFLKSSEKFLATIEERVEKLRGAVACGDPVQVAHVGHSLKGSFRTLGANHLAEVVETLEKDFSQMSSEAVEMKMREAFDSLIIYKRELSQFADQIRSTNPA